MLIFACDEIQPHHFKALTESLSYPDLWSLMLDKARSVPEAIASVSKRLPPELEESVWTTLATENLNQRKLEPAMGIENTAPEPIII